MTRSRPKALVTAAVSGPGLDLLHQLADLVLDSWLDQPTLRIYNAAQLAERVASEGASVVIVEGDVCGAELYEQPVTVVCSCRGDPTNVDVAAATAAGVPVLRAPVATRTPWPNWRSPSSLPPPAGSFPPTTTYGRARSTATARSPTSAIAPGSWPAGRSGW